MNDARATTDRAAAGSLGIAVFGGAFNPPHRTHQRLAAAALAQLPVATLLVVPAGDHPHKAGTGVAAAMHRLRMCAIAFAGMPGVVVDDRELQRPGPSFTVDTLAELAAMHPGRQLWFVIGADNLRLLPTWRDHHRLLALANVATFPRAGVAADDGALRGLDLDADERRRLLQHRLQFEPDAVAAADLRARLQRGERSLAELPAGVEAYVLANHLYGT